MKKIYRGFKTECPTGLITEEAFQGIYSKFFPHGGIIIPRHKFDSNYIQIRLYIFIYLWTKRKLILLCTFLSNLSNGLAEVGLSK